MGPLPRMAWRNVRKNWRHSLASLSSIAAGFLALGVFEGYVSGLYLLFGDKIRQESMLGDVLIEKRGSAERGDDDPWAYTMDEREQKVIEEVLAERASEISASVRFLDLGGMVTSGKTTTVFAGQGFDPEAGAQLRAPDYVWNVKAGTPLETTAGKTVLLGQGLGKVLDCIPGPEPEKPSVVCKRKSVQLSTTTETGQLNAIDPQVGGLIYLDIKEFDLRFVAMPLAMAQRLADTKRISRYAVELHDPEQANEFRRWAEERIRAKGVGVEVTHWFYHRFAEIFRRGIELLTVFRNFVALVVLVVAGMSVFNTMAKTVSERTREIGSLRALGFLRSQVIRLFVLEGSLLAVLGVAFGLVVTLCLVGIVNVLALPYDAGMMAEPIPLIIAYSPKIYLESAVFLIGVAVVAAFLPARRASRMSVPDALGHT